jgi:hypothetical protein
MDCIGREVSTAKPNSIHLREVSMPSIGDVAEGRGVLVRVLRVGVDGTDKEINAAEYGAAPEGFGFLVVGHESHPEAPGSPEFGPAKYDSLHGYGPEDLRQEVRVCSIC